MKKISIDKFIDRCSPDPCLIQDSVYIPKGEQFQLRRVQFGNIEVMSLKKAHGEKIQLSFDFIGKAVIKVGVSSVHSSFAWCGEKTLSSARFINKTVDINLIKVKEGILEISILALEESSLFFGNCPVALTGDFDQKTALYSFVSPTLDLCCEEPLYYLFNDIKSYYSFEDGSVHLYTNTVVDMLTYFNSFSAKKWKKFTNVDNLTAYLDFEGKAIAEAVHLSELGKTVLSSWVLESRERQAFVLPLGDYPSDGIIGIRIIAESSCVFYGGGWGTDAIETQPVRLGIGITTFRREESVKSAVARLVKAISNHHFYSDKITITVVDNGQTLNSLDLTGATLIPNKNLGGTGGFMRSLIHYQDSGEYTHCLFMDDDASCEASSVFRSMSFLRHALSQSLALSGAMLFENIQFKQWENGAWFDSGCHPLKHNFDLRDKNKLLENEQESNQKIYGAWWFFVFPIAEAKNYSLPFFVRGDDIDFSYMNNFLITTLNGVSCWQQDFKTKECAMTVYLFLRSHIVHHLTISRLKCSYRTIWEILWKHFSAYNDSYFYGTAACINLAIEHVIQGPEFWEKNITPAKILREIKKLSACEISKHYTEQEKKKLIFAEKNLKTSIFPIIFRKLTLNGHLLPKCMMRKAPFDMVFKWMMPNRNRVYMRRNMIILDDVMHLRMNLKRNVKFYFANLFKFIFLNMIFYVKYSSLRKTYTSRAVFQRSKGFWEKQIDE